MSRTLRALWAVSLLSGASWAGAAKRPGKAVMSHVEVVDSARLKAAVPRGWRATRDRQGLMLSGPARAGEPEPAAAAVYYPEGNPHFKDAAAFLARQSAPSPVPVSGEKTHAPEKAELAGRPAKVVRRDTFAVHRGAGERPREVPVREEIYVVAGKDGFWVLSFSAPRASWDANAAVFKAIRDGFSVTD